MRVLHIVPFVAAGGASGGPIQVAIGALRTLRARGHQVLLVTTVIGGVPKDGIPPVWDGRTVLLRSTHVLPRVGFASLVSIPMVLWVIRHHRGADAIHIHLARDLVTIPTAAMLLATGRPFVVQTHGMIAPSTNPLARALDALVTRRALRGATAVVCLSDREGESVQQVARGRAAVVVVPNGIDVQRTASSTDDRLEVLFLARLHRRKRPELFVRMAARLAQRHPDVRFTLVGPDEGEAEPITRLIDSLDMSGRIAWEGGIDPAGVQTRMAQSSIYVLPAQDEPFGLTVLEAMAAGVPVVVERSAVLADTIELTASGSVFEFDPDGADLGRVVSRYLDDSALRARHGANALDTVRREFSLEAVADRLGPLYEQLSSSSTAHRPRWPRRRRQE